MTTERLAALIARLHRLEARAWALDDAALLIEARRLRETAQALIRRRMGR